MYQGPPPAAWGPAVDGRGRKVQGGGWGPGPVGPGPMPMPMQGQPWAGPPMQGYYPPQPGGGSALGVDWGQVALLVVLLGLIFLLWDTKLVYPVKLLVVFFHESSHGIAAVLTGGTVNRLEISPLEGGACYTSGGNRVLVLSAGYLGSMVWGGIILLLASRTRFDRHVSLILGTIVVLIGLAFVRPLVSFGQLFVVAAGVGLYAIGTFLPEQVNDVALRVIGLTSCMYAPLDIKSDVLDRPFEPSDAAMISELTGVPTKTVGFAWIAISVVCTVYFLIIACRPQIRAHRMDPNFMWGYE